MIQACLVHLSLQEFVFSIATNDWDDDDDGDHGDHGDDDDDADYHLSIFIYCQVKFF